MEKRDSTTNSHYLDWIQAVHVEAVGAHAKITNRLIKHILSTPEFQHRYVCDVRLVPSYDRNSSPYIQDKIRRCIVQHGQFCKCVISNTCDGIEFLDQTNKPLKKTLRQLILGIPDSHFINIDLNWSASSFAILYPKKYEDMARDKIANLGAYLFKTYGDDVLQSLPADTQEFINEVTWDDTTGRPLSKLDRELDDILEVGDALDYVDITHLTTPTERPTIVAASDTFIPQLDTASVSTFGTISPTARLEVASPVSHDSSLNHDNGTVVSAITVDSRFSSLETSFGNVEEMLRQLVSRTNLTNIGDLVTPPTASQSAGAANAASAAGV